MVRLASLQNRLSDVFSGAPVVFHHLPKCGGTSVARALRLRYALSFSGFMSEPTYRAMEALHPDDDENTVLRRVKEFREQQLLSLLYFGVRCIAGHVRFSTTAFEKFSGDYKFITTLREPTELLISSYFYDSKHNNERWRNNGSIEEYLEGERARMFGAVYSSFYSGLPHDADARTVASIEQAKANLLRLAAVGFVDDLSRFERRLRELLGVRIRIGHSNRSRVSRPDREQTLTPAVRRRIEEISAPNLEVYEFARARLHS